MNPQDRPWWQMVGAVEFSQRAQQMPLTECRALDIDLLAAIDGIESQLALAPREERPEWYRRARAALALTTRKRGILRKRLRLAELAQRTVKDTQRGDLLQEAAQLNEAGDTQGALRLVLRVLDPK